jgi:cysteinyl-tRNA synthetase
MKRIKNTISNLQNMLNEVKSDKLMEGEIEYIKNIDSYRDKYIEKMDDDFNTADAISVIFDLIRDINTNVQNTSSKALIYHCLDIIKELGAPLGILQNTSKGNIDEEIEKAYTRKTKGKKRKKLGTFG